MTIRFHTLNRSVSVAAFVVSLLLTAGTLNSVVVAAGASVPQASMIAVAETPVTQG